MTVSPLISFSTALLILLLSPFRQPFLQTYTDYLWSKGEHPKFTDIRSHWNNAIWSAREKVVKYVEDIKK
jgi:hypothetical protein